MKAFLRNGYARFKLKTLFFDDRADRQLTDYINLILRQGISNIEINAYYIRFTCMRMDCILWNGDKYAGWLSQGVIGGYRWSNLRPEAAAMLRFRRLVRRAVGEDLKEKLSEEF